MAFEKYLKSGSGVAFAQASAIRGVTPFSGKSTLFAALEDQLGVKLERGEEPVESLVIDSVEPPTEN